MPSLKELRIRKKSVQATKKITAAMKLIAAAKLRRAQEQVQAARPYAALMSDMLRDLVSKMMMTDTTPKLLRGTGQDKTHLIIAATSNRGLCGGFNSSIIREVRRMIYQDKINERLTKIICVGRKGHDQLRRDYEKYIVATFEALDKPTFFEGSRISAHINEMFEAGGFDTCTIVYNKFITALTQKVTTHRLIPYTPLNDSLTSLGKADEGIILSEYDYEPDETQVLAHLLPQNLSVQIFRTLLENTASEQGARMAAMDGATRNAEDMIRRLDLTYNRTRQAFITRELIEIISGAEAL